MWIYDMMPHRVAQTFCLHISRYEMEVYAHTSKMAFVKTPAILCHGNLHFQQFLLLSYSQQLIVLSPESFIRH